MKELVTVKKKVSFSTYLVEDNSKRTFLINTERKLNREDAVLLVNRNVVGVVQSHGVKTIQV
jgi:hypothetical protein